MAKRRRHMPDQIIRKLAESNKLLGGGAELDEVCRHLQITESTWHRWVAQYGGTKASDAKRLKELEDRLQREPTPQRPRRPHPQRVRPSLDHPTPTSTRIAAGPLIGARSHSAAAVGAGVEALITRDSEGFPTKALGALGLRVVDPDTNLLEVFDEFPDEVTSTIVELARTKTRPPMTVDDVLDALQRAGSRSCLQEFASTAIGKACARR